MKLTQDRIEKIRINGYQLDFGSVFEHAFENYKKIALYAGLMLLVFSILLGIILVGLLFSFFDMDTLTESLKQENLNPDNFSINFLSIYSASIVLFTCLISPFQAGFFKMADCGERGSEFHVSTIFEYYKSPYFIEIFISTFLITLMSSGLSILMDFSGFKLVGTLIAFIISFVTFMSVPLIVFGNLKAIDAIKSSITIVSKQPLVLLGLLILGGIASMVGFIGCFIGVFFTIPFMYSMNYAIYAAIIGFDSKSELDEIETSKR